MKRLLFLSMMLFMFLSCGSNNKNNSDKTQNEIVFANFRDIRDLNPHNYKGEMYAQNMIFEGLVKINKEGKIEPSLAEKWEISENGKEYTFYLRKGVVFSDGEPFNAEVVKANFDAILANKDRHGWLESVRVFEKLNVIDEYTVKIELKDSYFPFLIDLGVIRPFRFISPKAMKNGGTKDGVNAYIGTGPYTLKENKVDSEAIFEVNEKYWGKKPAIKTVRVKVIPENETRILSLEKGEIDLIFGKEMIDAESYENYKNKKGFAVKMSQPVATRMLMLNTSKGVLKDKKLRKALQHIVNRKELAEQMFLGTEEPAETLFAKSIPYANIDLPIYDFSLDKAGKILDEIGWKIGADGIREKNGEKLLIKIHYNSDNVNEKQLSEYFQQQAKKVGVKVDLFSEEEQSNRDRKNNGDFEIVFGTSWGAPYDPQSFIGSMTHNPGHGDYMAQLGLPGREQLYEKIAKVLVITNESERENLFKEIMTELHDEAIYIPFTYEKNRIIYNEKIKNVDFDVSTYEIPFYKMSY